MGRLSIAVAVGLLITAAPIGHAAADPHSDANAADRRGDYATELRILKPQAELGQAWAQNNLGTMYLMGTGVPRNYVEALSWFRLSAAQDDPGGESNLGQMYENGLAVPADSARAAQLYLMSAGHGRADAWPLLKRLCDDDKTVSRSLCARIPEGTQSEPGLSIRAADEDLRSLGEQLMEMAIAFLSALVVWIFLRMRSRTISRRELDGGRETLREPLEVEKTRKRERLAVGITLIAASVVLFAWNSTQLGDSQEFAALPFWVGVLFLFWANSKGAFWKPVAVRASVVLRRILILSALSTASILTLLLATSPRDRSSASLFIFLAGALGIATIVYGFWMIVLWVRSLVARMATPMPIPTTPGAERSRAAWFYFRASLAVLLSIWGITLALQSHYVSGGLVVVIGLLAAIGAYRTRKRAAPSSL
jgi:hypothetical protein